MTHSVGWPDGESERRHHQALGERSLSTYMCCVSGPNTNSQNHERRPNLYPVAYQEQPGGILRMWWIKPQTHPQEVKEVRLDINEILYNRLIYSMYRKPCLIKMIKPTISKQWRQASNSELSVLLMTSFRAYAPRIRLRIAACLFLVVFRPG